MSLPAAWVDRIFEKLTMAYGHDFLRRWEGLDMALVKADWAHELAFYAAMPHAIRFALETLPPDKPPTARTSRALCSSVPVVVNMGLPPPSTKPPPAVAARLASVGQSCGDPRAWARRLRDIEFNRGGELPNGRQLTGAQRAMWRTALAAEQEAA